MSESILTSVKKILGIDASYTEFDVDIIMHINSAFATLNQLGVGPAEGFMIMDAVPTWDDFLFADNRLNFVKTYVCLKTRIVFDPPASSYLVSSMQEQLKELEFRIYVSVDSVPANEIVYDGGVP